MAARIVVLGPEIDGELYAMEINADDAGALIAGERPTWRISLTKHAGELSDAMVLLRVRPWDEQRTSRSALEVGWDFLKILIPYHREFRITKPVPYSENVSRAG